MYRVNPSLYGEHLSWLIGIEMIRLPNSPVSPILMAAVGLGTSFRGLRDIGLKPLGVGLFSAALVGAVSVALISATY